MDTECAILALAALAQGTRLDAFKLLVRFEPNGLPAGEVARELAVPHNTMSAHLSILSRAGLVTAERRSRTIIYRADLATLRAMTLFLVKDCCQGRPELCASLIDDLMPCCQRPPPMPERIYNVLFLCTGNSARSILAEAVLRETGAGRFQAFSAGSHPKDEVNTLALKELTHVGLPTEGLRSKSWDEFAAPGAPVMDFVFTVCDSAAGETCPVWPGQPITAHWGIEDPAEVEGSDLDQARAFTLALRYLKTRISLFLALPIAALDELSLQAKIREIGQAEGASHPRSDVA